MARGTVKVRSVNGALTVTFTTASGRTPTVYSDSALTTTQTLPATVADGATGTFYFASPGAYTMSVKTATGIQIAADLNTTRVINVDHGQTTAYDYDTRLVSSDASGDSGRHSPGKDLSATYAAIRNLRATGVADNTASRLDVTLARATRVATPLTIPTGGTGDVVEPDILFDPDGTLWGHKYLLVAARYDGSSSALENPALWVSDDGTTWSVPAGVTNPIFAQGVQGDGDNSDPALVLGHDGRIYMLWNQYNAAGTHTLIKCSSCDPANLASWTTPVTVIDRANATSRPITPSGFYDPVLGTYVFYTLDITNAAAVYPLQRWTASSPDGTWTASAAPTMTWPLAGRSPWHLNAYLVGDQHVMLISDTTTGLSGPGHLFLAVSYDRGVTWTVSPLPVMWSPGNSGFWDAGLYRSCMVPAWRGDDFSFDLFYGGTDNAGAWRLGRTSITFPRQREGSAVQTRTTTGKNFYYTTPNTQVGTWVVTSNGDIRVTPIFFDRTVTISEMGVEVTAAGDAGTVARFGIYADNGSGAPGQLITDFGTSSTAGTGYVSKAGSVTLPPGMYWPVAVIQGETTSFPTLRAHATGSPRMPGIASATALTVTQSSLIAWRMTPVLGALSQVFDTAPAVSGFAPAVLCKVT